MKTLIAVPCMDQVPMPFCQSLALLRKVGDCVLSMQCGSLVYSSRDSLAMRAVQCDADHVFWLDSDMVFEPDTLARMMRTMKERDLDILTGMYFRRVLPYTPVLFDKLEIDGEKADYTEFTAIPKEIFEVGGCGFGCVLMKTDVIFDVHGKFGKMFAPIGGNGEDVAFCWRARQCGYQIFCDPSIKLGHVGYSTIGREVYEAFKESHK